MGKAKSQWEKLNLIRREKFDLILPKVMRENKIDMWIHVMQESNPDALTVDLGGDHGYFIFTDRPSYIKIVLYNCFFINGSNTPNAN